MDTNCHIFTYVGKLFYIFLDIGRIAKSQAPTSAGAPAHRKASGGGASRRQAKFQINYSWPIGHPRTMKIDLKEHF